MGIGAGAAAGLAATPAPPSGTAATMTFPRTSSASARWGTRGGASRKSPCIALRRAD